MSKPIIILLFLISAYSCSPAIIDKHPKPKNRIQPDAPPMESPPPQKMEPIPHFEFYHHFYVKPTDYPKAQIQNNPNGPRK